MEFYVTQDFFNQFNNILLIFIKKIILLFVLLKKII